MKITSLQNETIKKLVRLKNKKDRDEQHKILVEGEHLRQEVMSTVLSFQTIGLDEGNDLVIVPAIAEKLSQTKSGSTVFTLVEKPKYDLPLEGRRYLLCDGVQDPGNLGTMIRTAYSFGFDAVLLSKDCVDEYNDKVIRSTQGAIFHIPVIRCDLVETIKELQKNHIEVYATYLGDDTKSLSDVKGDALAVVMGSEGTGVSKAVLEVCDGSVKIETSQFESLNVAVATGIVCYVLKD